MWETVRIHLDEVRGLGSFLELEAVAEPGSDLARERAQVAHLRAALEIADDALREGSYADALGLRSGRRRRRQPDRRAARARPRRRGRAYAPYSNFPVGAARAHHRRAPLRGRERGERGVPAGPVRRGVGDRRARRRRRRADRRGRRRRAQPELCTPCGGCRQRLREFTADDAPIHLVDLERVRRTTSLGELLPLSFGPEHLAA